MSNTTLQILQNLKPGANVQLFSDAMAVHIGKTGLTVVAMLCAAACVYYLLCSLGMLGAAKRSVFTIGITIIAGIAAFLLHQKAEAFRAIDPTLPILTLTATTLDYDVRRNGWSIPWTHIEAIHLHTTTTRKKQSVDNVSYEIRVIPRPNAALTWKYEPASDNDIAAAKQLMENSGYVLIDPEPLGIAHEPLQKALEKYRAGL